MGMMIVPTFDGEVYPAPGSITNVTIATDAIDANAIAEDAILEALNTVFPADPVAGSLGDMLSKTDNNTYSRDTDSLEALSDAIASLTTGTFMQRSSQSASIQQSASEVTLFELAPSAVFEYGGGAVSLPASAGAAGSFKVYIKVKSGGAYVDITPTNIGAYAGTAGAWTFAPVYNGAANAKHAYVPRFNRYGMKITFQQGTEGAGYVVADSEHFNSLGS